MKQLLPPTWKNGPAICRATMLPAFATEKAAKDWVSTLPGLTLDAVNACHECQGFHAISHPRPPSGASSGSSKREQTGKTKGK